MFDLQKFRELTKNLPRFEDGRINYKDAKDCFVLSLFLKFNDEFLILKRSDKVATHKGKWHTVAGYIDEEVTLREKAVLELFEEIGAKEDVIKEFIFGQNYEKEDAIYGKVWHIYPILGILKYKPEVKLDFEHTEYKWVHFDELQKYDLVPSFMESLKLVGSV